MSFMQTHAFKTFWHTPARWRLGPDLDQDEADALQVLHVLLEESGRNVLEPRFFLQPAGQSVSRVGAVAAVPPRCCRIAGMVTFLGEEGATPVKHKAQLQHLCPNRTELPRVL